MSDVPLSSPALCCWEWLHNDTINRATNTNDRKKCYTDRKQRTVYPVIPNSHINKKIQTIKLPSSPFLPILAIYFCFAWQWIACMLFISAVTYWLNNINCPFLTKLVLYHMVCSESYTLKNEFYPPVWERQWFAYILQRHWVPFFCQEQGWVSVEPCWSYLSLLTHLSLSWEDHATYQSSVCEAD